MKLYRPIEISVHENSRIKERERYSKIRPKTNKRLMCSASASGDLAGGEYKCIDSGKLVHALLKCSYAEDEEEGFGQKKFCQKFNEQ